MDDHSHFIELAALAAGGDLTDEERKQLDEHLETCADCNHVFIELGDLIRFGLPLGRSQFRQRIEVLMSHPDAGARDRFLRRASSEGIRFSSDVFSSYLRGPSLRFVGAGLAAVVALVIAYLFGLHPVGLSNRVLTPIGQQSSMLETRISQLQQSLEAEQRETESLRSQIAALTMKENTSSHNDEQTRGKETPSSTYGSHSFEENEKQQEAPEKSLSDARDKLERLNKEHAADQASLVAEQIRINELSEQLRAEKTNMSNMQRQLVSVGGDARNLMGARQLHVVDVRDTDPDGKPGKAFGRIFLTEGKSLVFYAFDLNDISKNGAKKTFQVWGRQEGKANSLHSLGILNVDNKAQRRWALKTDDVTAFARINSIFVTVEPQGGAKSPDGQRLLFAHIGEVNHP